MWWWVLTISGVILAFLIGVAVGATWVAIIDDRLMARLGINLLSEPPVLQGRPPCSPGYESEL